MLVQKLCLWKSPVVMLQMEKEHWWKHVWGSLELCVMLLWVHHVYEQQEISFEKVHKLVEFDIPC